MLARRLSIEPVPAPAARPGSVPAPLPDSVAAPPHDSVAAPPHDPDPDVPPAGRVLDPLTVVAVLLGAILTLVAFMVLGGAAPRPAPAGLPDAGPVVGWLVPTLRVLMDLAAVVTVGCLTYAAVLGPARQQAAHSAAGQALRIAARSAAVWVGTAIAGAGLAVADISGLSLPRLLQAGSPWWLFTVSQSRQLLLVAGLAALALLVTRSGRTAEGPFLALALAVCALLPPLLSGHAASEGYHTLSTASLIVHVVAASFWVGGLLAVLLFARTPGTIPAVLRFSTLALACFVATAVSGLLNAWIRLRVGDGIGTELFDTGYGALLVAKVTALGALATFGYWHRRRTLGQLAAGQPGAFRRFAGCEVLVMVATIALAVALSRTPTPVREAAEAAGAAGAGDTTVSSAVETSMSPASPGA